MTVLRTAYVNVLPKTDEFDPELKKRLRRIDAGREGAQVATRFGAGFSGTFGSIVSRSAGIFAAGFAVVSSVRVFSGFIADARESEKVSRLTASAIRATGDAAMVTAEQVGNLATAISNKTGKDDEAIQSGQNMLLTFKGIRNQAGKNNDIFNQASSVLTDMVAAMNNGNVTQENMSTGASGLGKAHNDPVKGVTALTRVGVTFTDKQKEQIKSMVDAGNVAGAQKIILGELKSEFGGAAAASSDMGERAKVAIGNMGEFIGGLLLPAFEKVTTFITARVVPGVQSFIGGLRGEGALAGFSGKLNTLGLGLRATVSAFREGDVTSGGFVGAMERIGVAARRVFDFFKAEILPRFREFGGLIRDHIVPALGEMASFIGRNKDFFVPFIAVIGGAVVAIKALTVATAVYKVVAGGLSGVLGFLTSPITLVVVALAALVAGTIYAYKHSETFRTIVQAAWQGIQAVVSFAWNNVIKPAVEGLVSFFRNVIAPTVMWLWRNVFGPSFTAIGFIVKAAWVVIQFALAAMKLYLENVIFPVIRLLWNNVVKPVFAGIGATVSFTWNKVIKPVFSALGSFIRDNVAPAFRKGVDAIRAAWDKIKEAAAGPVRFVIQTVINKGIIGGINWVASKVGVKDRIPELGLPKGLGDGFGAPAARRALPRGAGDGFGDLLDVFKGPAKWLTDRVSGPLGDLKNKFGGNPLTGVVLGMGNKAKNLALDKLTSLLNVGDTGSAIGRAIGRAASLAGLQPGILGVLGSLRATFGNVPVISGYRRGATTLSGNVSYHASGRAIDIAPVLAWAQFLRAAWGGRLRELITPWNQLNILNGRPHRYSGAVWNQHNFAGGNAHIHAALANGGVITEPIFGVGASGRTYSLGERGPETVIPGVPNAAPTYNINVYASPLAHPADVGKEVVQVIQAFERRNGDRWRR